MTHAYNSVAWEAESEGLSQLQCQCEVYYECKDRVNYGVKPYPNVKSNPQSLLVLKVQEMPIYQKDFLTPGTSWELQFICLCVCVCVYKLVCLCVYVFVYLYTYIHTHIHICDLLQSHANLYVPVQHSQNHKVIQISFHGWIGLKH